MLGYGYEKPHRLERLDGLVNFIAAKTVDCYFATDTLQNY
jgi:hypothetical protein